jgi:UDP-MurNAc hydroxylase
MTQITHLGHAGFNVEYNGFRLVCDPWFTPAFLKSWFPWPDNREMQREAQNADALYLSHAHEDHFDRNFLSYAYPADIPVIVPKFRSRYMERKLKSLGYTNVIALEHGQYHQPTGGMRLTMLTDRSHKEDSALLVDAGAVRFLDSNDCELASSDWPNQVDVLAAQFSGAFWYPHCYQYPKRVMEEKARAVRDNNLDRLYNRVARTGTKLYIPSAGPAVFLDPVLDSYNDSPIFPEWHEVAGEFAEHFPDVTVQAPARSDMTREEYRLARLHDWDSWYDEPDDPAAPREIEKHFEALRTANKAFMADYSGSIVLNAGSRTWKVPLSAIKNQLEEAPDPHYFLDVPPRVLRAVLDGRATWETALLSNRIKLYRDPDKYDLTLMSLLSFGDRPAQTRALKQLQQSDEMTTNCGYTYQRWCPHAGEDLSGVQAYDGILQCPRHNWRWDLATGTCLEGQLPLKIQPDGSR